MPSSKQVLTGILGLGLTLTGLSLALPAAQADISVKVPTPYPYVQEWTSASLITANDDWSGVVGVEGFLGQDITTSSSGADPQGLLAAGSLVPNDKDVIANNTTGISGVTSGGVIESETNQSIAFQGSATADAPYIAFHLDLTGKQNASFAFVAKDLDGSADNAAQQIAVHYRVGNSGSYTNLPTGYIADATTQNTATQVTARSVALPADVDNQPDVYVRVMTTNASGSDEWVGIDNINITAGNGDPEPDPLKATSPGNKTGQVGALVAPFTMAATGGVEPYTWSATGLPDGVSIDPTTGEVSGGATTACTCSVTATVTDDEGATDDVTFDFTVTAAPEITPIAEIQGTGARSPFAPATGNAQGDTKTTEGVVTAMYRTGGFNGMYIQTGGTGGETDATPDASDGLFVFGSSSMPDGVEVGDSVRVTGGVSDFGGTSTVPDSLTEITPSAGGVLELATDLDPVTPLDIAYPETAAEREKHEGELLAPTDTLTVTNNFNTNNFGEIGLATGEEPLKQPTEFVAPSDTAGLQAIVADNAARAVTLDDGSSTNYLSNQATKAIPLPWLTAANGSPVASPPRVGAEATLESPVILDFRNSIWKFQPLQQVTGDNVYPGGGHRRPD
jgi:5'-nucleotidase